MEDQPSQSDEARKVRLSLSSLADRLGVSPVALVIGVLAVAAAAFGGWWALRSPSGPDVAEILPTVEQNPLPVPETTPPPVATIVVQVAGAVVRPGVHELPAGSRWGHAIDAAGGFSDDADSDRVNQAERATDGARLWVPSVGDAPEPDLVEPTESERPEGTEGPTPDSPVNINTADAAALETLPGIGPAIAARIIAYRGENGPFASVDELDNVSGIGPTLLEQIRLLVSV